MANHNHRIELLRTIDTTAAIATTGIAAIITLRAKINRDRLAKTKSHNWHRGAVARSPLPHRPTCGSAPGGSVSTLTHLVFLLSPTVFAGCLPQSISIADSSVT
jgi:hypothetical protein